MNFIPEDELKPKIGSNFAPMIDFLFLMIAFFAHLALSRIATKETDVQLVKIKEEKKSSPVTRIINIRWTL